MAFGCGYSEFREKSGYTRRKLDRKHTNEIFFINVIQFNTFNNFYQVQIGYNTDFEIIIYDKDNIFYDSIIGEIPEGNLTVSDILNYLQLLLINIINISYDKIKNKFIFTTISSNVNHAYIYLKIINCDYY